MTAVARIATDRIPDVLLVPSEAVFVKDGSPVVYVLDGSMFDERQVQLSKRGKEQSVVAAGVEPGARVATRRPGPEFIRRAQ
jgi:multidrug efflux pump subunit AcrA (membrane-fusion protein)